MVYHHRGAALLAQGNVLTGGMAKHPVYLWTLPMFHCNGWCFPWSISAVAGTHLCLRYVRAKAVFDALADHKVTHLCGAPIVMATLINAPAEEKRPLPHVVQFFTAAAPPPEAVLAGMADAGFNVTHLYGLTETYGPAVINDWHGAWDDLGSDQQVKRQAHIEDQRLSIGGQQRMKGFRRDAVSFHCTAVSLSFRQNEGQQNNGKNGSSSAGTSLPLLDNSQIHPRMDTIRPRETA